MSKVIKTYDLVTAQIGEGDDLRDEWLCYEALHSGEGPCVRPQAVLANWNISAKEAAEKYASRLARREAEETGHEIEDGDCYHVAVQVSVCVAKYFEVMTRVEIRYEAESMPESITPKSDQLTPEYRKPSEERGQ